MFSQKYFTNLGFVFQVKVTLGRKWSYAILDGMDACMDFFDTISLNLLCLVYQAYIKNLKIYLISTGSFLLTQSSATASLSSPQVPK